MSLESAHLSISQPHQTHFVKFHPCPGERHSQEAEQWLKRTTSASGLAVVAVEVARAVAVHARHEARRRVPHRLFGKRWGWASVPPLDIKHKYRTGHATHSIVLVLQACAYAIGHEKTREHSPCPPATGRMPLHNARVCRGGWDGWDMEVGDLRRRSRGPSPGRQRRQAACGQRGRAGGLSRKASAHARTRRPLAGCGEAQPDTAWRRSERKSVPRPHADSHPFFSTDCTTYGCRAAERVRHPRPPHGLCHPQHRAGCGNGAP